MSHLFHIIGLSVWISAFAHKPTLFISLLNFIFGILRGCGIFLLAGMELLWNAVLVFIMYETIHYLVNLQYQKPKSSKRLMTNPSFERKMKDYSYRKHPAVKLVDSLPERWKNSDTIQKEISRYLSQG